MSKIIPFPSIEPAKSELAAFRGEIERILSPDALERFRILVGLIDRYSLAKLQPLHGEYASYACSLLGPGLMPGGWSADSRAKPEAWAAGAIWMLGQINSLTARDMQPYQPGPGRRSRLRGLRANHVQTRR